MEYFESAFEAAQKAWESPERRWFLQLRSPQDIWQENPSYLAVELFMYFWALLTLKHASKHRGRCSLLWTAALFHGLVTESLSYVLPDIDNFWHGRTMVMLFKQRLPLHIMLFYPCFHYTTNMVISNLKLPWWSEPFGVGLADLLLDIPFDILGIKFIWWTWHDTDPNIFDRTYSVPLTSYIFHLTFASSFTFLLNSSRWLLTGSRDKEKIAGNFFVEWGCVLITACLSMPMAAMVQFIPIYHTLHDLHNVHTEVCLAGYVALYVLLAWAGDRTAAAGDSRGPNTTGKLRRGSLFNELSLSVCLHFIFYMVLLLTVSPERNRSTGPHETIGDCSAMASIMTVTGMALPKRKYLCVSDYNEPVFDFHCLDELPSNGSSQYTICGTPYRNEIEYRFIILLSCIFGLAFFYQVFFKSSRNNKIKRA